MIAATKYFWVNLRQANQMPKLIMAHGIHLALFTKCFVNNVRIDKDEAIPQK